uniref:Uncharacterized protein n=1 Tax=Mandrillus leucophaeus TaxID=9568 RepID=A0A2K5XH41_MANLE
MPTHQPFPNTETVRFVVIDSARAYDCTLYVMLPLELMCPINVWDFAVLITKLDQKSIIFGCLVCVQETFLCKFAEENSTSTRGIMSKETHSGNFVLCFHIIFKTFEATLARCSGSHL